MKSKHLKYELKFYESAFGNNSKRRTSRFSWEYRPSKSVIGLVEKNGLKQGKGKRALDVGCGDGRHIAYFRSLGYSVVGVDFSLESLKLCRKRFAKDKEVELFQADLTKKKALEKLGQFDLVLDWSVLDHIREEYVKRYLRNLFWTIKLGGVIIFSEFDISLPGLFKNKDYKIVRGHYSKAYNLGSLVKTLRPLRLVDSREKVLEDEINNYKLNSVLMQKR
jgi:SAM-dependent methyltransferase